MAKIKRAAAKARKTDKDDKKVFPAPEKVKLTKTAKTAKTAVKKKKKIEKPKTEKITKPKVKSKKKSWRGEVKALYRDEAGVLHNVIKEQKTQVTIEILNGDQAEYKIIRKKGLESVPLFF